MFTDFTAHGSTYMQFKQKQHKITVLFVLIPTFFSNNVSCFYRSIEYCFINPRHTGIPHAKTGKNTITT